MKLRVLLLILMLSGFVDAKTSHRSLSLELLGEFQRSILDSTAISLEKQVLLFYGDSETIDYLNDLVVQAKYPRNESAGDTIKIQLQLISLSLNPVHEKSFRNSQYLRMLKLAVDYRIDDKTYKWQGSISDKVSKADMDGILNEWFPEGISGDYRRGQPTLLSLIITSLAVLSLGAALFFIRS